MDLAYNTQRNNFKIDSRVYLLALNSLWQLELWEYLASSDEWTRKTDFPGTASKNIRATAIGSKAIISLGALYDHADIYETWEYNADTDEWRQKTDFHYLDLDDASLFTYNNTAYLCACNLDTGIKIYTYNEGQGQWNYVSDYPGRSTAGIKAFSAAGRLFFGFGRNTYSDYRIELYEYFPETNLWDRYISIDRTASGLFAFSGTEKAFVIAEEQYSQTHLMYEFIPPEADIN